MKRGYFVIEHILADYGYAVVANTTKEAKKLLWKHSNTLGEGEWEWINLRANWKRGAKVDHLPIGVIEDLRVGLECGIFSYIENFDCDVCGSDDNNFIRLIDGKAMCEECEDKLLRSDDQ